MGDEREVTEPKMLHMLLVVDWAEDLALADYEAPAGEDDFDEVEADVRDAYEHLAVGKKRDQGPWLFTGSWDADPDDPGGAPVLDGEWRRLTAEEAVRWATDGRLWPVPAYMASAEG